MKDNWFEDKMNERFENFDSDLDLNAAWANLEERRQPKKKKRRAGIFWWFGAGIALVVIGIGFLFNTNKKVGLFNDNKTTLLNDVPEGLETENCIQTPNNQTITKKQNSTTSSQNKLTNQENTHRKKSLEKENNKIKSYTEFKHSTQKNLKLPLNTILSPFENKETIFTSPKESPNQEINPPVALMESLEEKGISLLVSQVVHYDIDCSFRGTPLSKLHTIGIAFNYGKAFRSTPIGRGLNSAYLQRRDMAETPLDTWSAQLFYQLKNRKQWFGRVNLGFLQSVDLFTDDYAASEMILMSDQIVQINRYPDGITEEIRGAALVKLEERGTGKFYQRYRQAFVGLEFGKEKSLRSGFNLRAAVGGDFIIYQNNIGKVYANETSFGVYKDLSEISSNRNIFAAKLRLEIGKSFANSNEISLGIVGKANLNTLDNDLGRRQYLLSELSYRKNF